MKSGGGPSLLHFMSMDCLLAGDALGFDLRCGKQLDCPDGHNREGDRLGRQEAEDVVGRKSDAGVQEQGGHACTSSGRPDGATLPYLSHIQIIQSISR